MAAATVLRGPCLPFGYDTGLDLADDLPSLEELEDMRADLLTTDFNYGQYSVESPVETFYSSAVSDVGKSPGKSSLHDYSTGASSSRSPTAASLILTPSSTPLGYHGEVPEDSEITDGHTSPSTDGFVLINHFGNESSGDRAFIMNNRPPQAASGSGVQPSHQQSRASSVVSSAATLPHHWPSFASTTTTDEWMDHSSSGQYDPFGANIPTYANTVAEQDAFNQDLDNAVGSIDASAYGSLLPFRTLEDGSVIDPRTTVTHGIPFAAYAPHQHGTQLHAYSMAHQRQQQRPTAPPNVAFVAASQQAMMPTTMQSAGHVVPVVPSQQMPPTYQLSQAQRSHASMQRFTSAARPRRGPYPHSFTHLAVGAGLPTRPQQRAELEAQAPVVRPLRAAVAGPSRRVVAGASPSPSETRPRGGRKKHSHLPDAAKAKSHSMRKTVACWRCALQRDPVSHKTTYHASQLLTCGP